MKNAADFPARQERGLYVAECWLAHNGVMENGRPMPPCDGRLVRTHLIPRQLIGRVVDAPRFAEVVDDPRSFVIACGGPLGNAGHHGHLDSSRRLRVPRDCIPQGTEDLAEELGLVWWLEREYGR